MADHERQLASLRDVPPQPSPAPPPQPEPPPPAEPQPLRPLVNLAYASFYPGEVRGDLRVIAIPAEATHLFLLFYVGQREPCASYELEIARRGDPPASFTIPDLRPLPGQEVSVAVPRDQMKDGSYRLRLTGLCDGGRGELGEYDVRLQEGKR